MYYTNVKKNRKSMKRLMMTAGAGLVLCALACPARADFLPGGYTYKLVLRDDLVARPDRRGAVVGEGSDIAAAGGDQDTPDVEFLFSHFADGLRDALHRVVEVHYLSFPDAHGGDAPGSLDVHPAVGVRFAHQQGCVRGADFQRRYKRVCHRIDSVCLG